MAGPASRHHPGWARSCRWRSHHARWAGSTERAWTPGFKFVHTEFQFVHFIISYISSFHTSFVIILNFHTIFSYIQTSQFHVTFMSMETYHLHIMFPHRGWEPWVWGVLATRPRLARWVVASSLAFLKSWGKDVSAERHSWNVLFFENGRFDFLILCDYYIIEIAIQHLRFKSDKRYETMESEQGKLESPWPCLRRDLLTSSSWTWCWPKARRDDKRRRTWYSCTSSE